jgi:hypothetical protein
LYGTGLRAFAPRGEEDMKQASALGTECNLEQAGTLADAKGSQEDAKGKLGEAKGKSGGREGEVRGGEGEVRRRRKGS